MIANKVQFEATKAHLELFEFASADMAKRTGSRTQLEQLELDAVRAQADNLSSEIAAHLRSPR